ncbi:MAG: histidine phosphatase family protein [Rhizobacter sp.]|jgi:phosphohistidine phosphatase|nr:histidine phosphatase family protein [Rhizobacter sp.]
MIPSCRELNLGNAVDLILWRHAEAEDQRAGQSDLERALTERGRRDAQRMGEWLGQRLAPTTRVLVSPARRTQQTAKALGRRFETIDAIAPDRSVQELLSAAGWPASRDPVLLVGHQPTLGMAAARVLCGNAEPWSMKKSGVWWFRAREGEHGKEVVLLSVQSPDLL